MTRDVLNSENSNFVMSQLKGDTIYRIELRAHNAIGFSQPTNLLMRTALGESANELGNEFTYDLASLAGGRSGYGYGYSGATRATTSSSSAVVCLFAACALCFAFTAL